jgi:hypothetical protein
MVEHLFSSFLEDREEYGQAVDYWVKLWEDVDADLREQFGWKHPWMVSDWRTHDVFMDGNPIFSAYSPQVQKGIRVIQHPPHTFDEIEFDMWLDTFGGPSSDPNAIRELVICCALSEEAAGRAYELIREWVQGPLSNSFQRQDTLSGAFIESFSRGAELAVARV